MSELKIYYSPNPHCTNAYYLKSEADKVIAELKNYADEFNKDFELVDNQNERLLKIVRHNKYKRCLAMAKRCEDKIDNPVQYDEHDDWLIITEYWNRWHKHWLELAEKFKPNNSTDQ